MDGLEDEFLVLSDKDTVCLKDGGLIKDSVTDGSGNKRYALTAAGATFSANWEFCLLAAG